MKSDNCKKISQLVENGFDTRLEATVFSYILDQGMNRLKVTTENEISKLQGNDIMTTEFLQSLVQTAVNICKEYTPMEIMEYIRINCYFSPFPTSLTLYKEDYTDISWLELCCKLKEDKDKKEVTVLVL